MGFGEEPLDHGTACAGIVAMAKDNGQCGVGVAYNSNIGGVINYFLYLYLLADTTHLVHIPPSGVKVNLSSATDAVESSALGYQYSYVDVYSNSWGPSDFGFTVSKPGPLAANTLRNGVTRVRSQWTCS